MFCKQLQIKGFSKQFYLFSKDINKQFWYNVLIRILVNKLAKIL